MMGEKGKEVTPAVNHIFPIPLNHFHIYATPCERKFFPLDFTLATHTHSSVGGGCRVDKSVLI
jgi:hypothetical protein